MEHVIRRVAFSIVGALVPAVAVAHPDHTGSQSYGLVHYLTDPFHVGTAVLGLVGVLLVVVLRRTRRDPAAVHRKLR